MDINVAAKVVKVVRAAVTVGGKVAVNGEDTEVAGVALVSMTDQRRVPTRTCCIT